MEFPSRDPNRLRLRTIRPSPDLTLGGVPKREFKPNLPVVPHIPHVPSQGVKVKAESKPQVPQQQPREKNNRKPFKPKIRKSFDESSSFH
jgi:hypothetical protein